MIKESIELSLPRNIVEKAQAEVESSEGLFEGIEDLIDHCITFWKRS